MVLYVGPDGRVTDGPAPVGSTVKAVALVDGILREVLVQNNPVSGGGGSVNFATSATQGQAVTGVLKALTAVTPGLTANALGLAGKATPAHTTGASVVTSATGTSKPSTTPGIGVGVVLVPSRTAATSGAELVRLKYDLTRTNGSNAATSTGAQPFPNPVNSQGLRDTVTSNAVGSATAAQSFTMRLAYPAPSGKDDLTITAVRLDFYLNHSSTLANTRRTLRATWTGGTYTSGAVGVALDALTVPITVNLFALGVTTWAQVASLVSFVDLVTDAAAINVGLNLDAVVLVVTATRTDLT